MNRKHKTYLRDVAAQMTALARQRTTRSKTRSKHTGMRKFVAASKTGQSMYFVIEYRLRRWKDGWTSLHVIGEVAEMRAL
jgi:hypothetical protein